MKKVQLFCLLMLVVVFSQDSMPDQDQDSVVIQSISARQGTDQYNYGGSLIGGQTVYLKVKDIQLNFHQVFGLDQTPSNNHVTIGDNPCIITDKGVNGIHLNCQTTAPVDSTALQGLTIKVSVDGKPPSTCTTGISCTYDYSYCIIKKQIYNCLASSPILYGVYPRANYPTQFSRWRARYLVSTADIKKLHFQKLGDNMCDRFNIVDKDDEDINMNDDHVQCQIASDIEGGKYPAQVKTDKGLSMNSYLSQSKNVFDDKLYSVTIIPQITSLGSNFMSPLGQILKINGFGFSIDSSKMSVQANGMDCEIVYSSSRQIHVEVPKAPDTSPVSENFYLNGQGLQYSRYDISALAKYDYKKCSLLRTDILAQDETLMGRLVESNTVPEPYTGDFYGTDYGQFWQGMFKAPITGKVRFFLASDDCAQFYIQTTAGSLDTESMTMIGQCIWAPIWNFDYQRSYYPNADQPDDSGVYTAGQSSIPVDVEKDSYYLIHIVHINGGGPGYVQVGFGYESDTLKWNSIDLIQQLNFNYNPQQEQLMLTVYNSAANTLLEGSFTLQMVAKDSAGKQVFDKKTDNISAKLTAQNVHDVFSWNFQTPTTVTAQKVDKDGNVLPDDAIDFAGRQFTITFTSWREYPVIPTITKTITLGTPVITISQIQKASNPIRGTYQLQFNEQQIQTRVNSALVSDLDYNTDVNQIANLIEGIAGFRPQAWSFGDYDDGFQYFFGFQGWPKDQDVPKLTINSNSLTGGQDTPKIDVSVFQERTNYMRFSSLPAELLFMYQPNPQVQLTVNGIMAACFDAICDYTLSDEKTPVITAFTRSAEVLSITITDPGNLGFTLIDFTVQFAGQNCIVTDYTDYVVTCSLPLLNSNPILEAGDSIPLLHTEQIGYAKLQDALSAETIPLTITGITPNSGSLNGGTVVVIEGTGFLSSPDRVNLTDFLLQLDNLNLTIISMTNTEIQAQTPAHAAATLDITISLNGKSATIGFEYTLDKTVIVSGLNETSASPITKSGITITGSHFGTVKKDVKVQLVQSDAADGVTPRVYDLNILDIADDSINAFLGGGRSGSYDLRVWRDQWGYSDTSISQDNFKYQLTVDSISPSTGSMMGGTIITITGTNFKDGDTQVFIGEAINWVCNLISVTETEIKCATPQPSVEYKSDEKQIIHVFARLTEEAVCTAGEGGCGFIYSQDQTPVVDFPEGVSDVDLTKYLVTDNPYPDVRRRVLQDENERGFRIVNHRRGLWSEKSKEEGTNHWKHFFHPRRNLLDLTSAQITKQRAFGSYKSYTLTGTGWEQAQVELDGKLLPEESIISRNDTSVTFTFPSLKNGFYPMKVYIPGKGYADKVWYASVGFYVWTISQTSGSQGGSLLFFRGTGFDRDNLKITFYESGVSKKGECQILEFNHDNFTCQSPQLTSFKDHTINFTQYDSFTQNVFRDYRNFSVNPNVPQINSLTIPTKDASGTYYVSYSGSEISFGVIGVSFTSPVRAFLRIVGTTTKIEGTVINTPTATRVDVTFSNILSGRYIVELLFNSTEFPLVTAPYKATVLVNVNTLTATAVTSSYAGGSILKLTGTGFPLSLEQNLVQVCGIDCPVTAVDDSSLSCQIPQLITENTQSEYQFEQEAQIIPSHFYTKISKNPTQLFALDDDQISTYYYEYIDNCYIDFDFGTSKQLKLKLIKYQPQFKYSNSRYIGAKFQYSLDGTTFIDIVTLDNSVHEDWNFYMPPDTISGIRKIRYTDPKGATQSQCRIAEIKLYGWIQAAQNNDLSAGTNCDVLVITNGNNHTTLAGKVQYTQASTPIVQTVSPLFGPTYGGTEITIQGTGFSNTKSDITVSIDNVPCTVSSATTTQIVCTTNEKDLSSNSAEGLFLVSILGQAAVTKQVFLYGNLYSDENTWGGDLPPREADTIYIPKGQLLVIDQNTPVLKAILVEGGLTFLDGENLDDLTLDAHYIIIREGKFWIGKEGQGNEYKRKLTITLHGHILETQMPSMGNKVLGCHQCTLDIHGVKPSHYFTLMNMTAEIGDTQVTVDDEVSWLPGQEIVIASSDWDHRQAERRIITEVDKKVIKFQEPLIYRHYSAIEVYGDEEFPMKIEVALLNRNIVIQGDPTDPEQKQYGGHMMIHGKGDKGAIGRIEHAEFRHSGQPKILGRYPIHFHLNGPMFNSYVRGNAIHDSHARCITIHGVHYLKVEHNVGFNAKGHMVFLEDGIETYNLIRYNLMMGAKQSWIMLQTDITVATFWITNPLNYVIENRSGGSEWYGLWYEIKQFPDGPSATSNVCPMGLNLGTFTNNTAHSNGRFGLRVFELFPRKFPCDPERNEFKADPFVDNPSNEAIFENFTTWKNNEAGVLGERLGMVTFRNFKIADSKLAGYQGHKANLSSRGVVVQNFLIVGKSQGNPSQETDYYLETRGIIAPRTNGFLVKDTRLYRYSEEMILLQSCSVCWHSKVWVTGGKNSHFQNLTFIDSDNARVLFWEHHRREIFWDLDGSIVGKYLGINQPAFMMPYKPHLDGVPDCITKLNDTIWNDTIICKSSSNLQVRDILLNNPIPSDDFAATEFKLLRLDPANEITNLSNFTEDNFTAEPMVKIKKSFDVKFSWAAPMITNYIYNAHWKFGIDFFHFGLFPSEYWKPEDAGIVFRFNYSAYRENFDIFKNIGGQLTVRYNNLTSRPDPATCLHGTYFNDRSNKFLYLCLSGKGKDRFEYVDIDKVICKYECDSVGQIVVDSAFTPWSSPDAWESGKVPQRGENGTIKLGKKILYDVDDSGILEDLYILGELHFNPDAKKPIKLQAKRIWVRGGRIVAGSPDLPFTQNLDIILHGTYGERALLIDDKVDASNKVLAVTGGIELFGVPPRTTWTRITAFANKGDKTLQVIEANDWKVGDQIFIGPSGRNEQEHEKFTIQAISGTTITLNDSLKYDHFGDTGPTIVKQGLGVLDMRAAVGHLTRNIRISGSEDVNRWGCRTLIYQFEEPVDKILRRGYGRFNGVEWYNCGQYDSSRGAVDFRDLSDLNIVKESYVLNSAFHESTGYQVNAVNTRNLTVENCTFYWGMQTFMSFQLVHQILVRNNLFVFMMTRQNGAQVGMVPWADFIDFVDADIDPNEPNWFTSDNIQVYNNVGQGSEDAGYYFMSTPCQFADKPAFFNNTCSSAVLGCHAFRQSDVKCSYVTGVLAFHSHRGAMIDMFTAKTKVTNFMFAELDIGLVIKPATTTMYDNPIYVENFWVSALARPSCTKCYAGSFSQACNNQIAIQLFSHSTSAFPPHSGKPTDHMDTICTWQSVEGRAFLRNIVFDNFRLSYPQQPNCANNHLFRQHHGSIESQAAHFLRNVTCQNCEEGSYFYYQDPDYTKVGWFGGCGSFECTGEINVIIEDQDGSLFGRPIQSFPNNKYLGPNVTDICTKVESWNGYKCEGTNLGMLYMMSVAPDFNKRMISPIEWTDGQWYNQINTMWEWLWDGPEPMNTRDSYFPGIVRLNSQINVTSAGMNPTDMHVYLGKKYPDEEGGSPRDWVIFKYQYFHPLFLEVSNDFQGKQKVIRPFIESAHEHKNLLDYTHVCGANNYFRENNTIHFVVTGALDCIVRVKQVNAVYFSSRLKVSPDVFWADGDKNIGNWLTLTASLMGLDPSTIKVVGARKPSRILQSTETETVLGWAAVDPTPIGGANYNPATIQQNLQTLADKAAVAARDPSYANQLNMPTELAAVEVSVITDTNFPSTEAVSSAPFVPPPRPNDPAFSLVYSDPGTGVGGTSSSFTSSSSSGSGSSNTGSSSSNIGSSNNKGSTSNTNAMSPITATSSGSSSSSQNNNQIQYDQVTQEQQDIVPDYSDEIANSNNQINQFVIKNQGKSDLDQTGQKLTRNSQPMKNDEKQNTTIISVIVGLSGTFGIIAFVVYFLKARQVAQISVLVEKIDPVKLEGGNEQYRPDIKSNNGGRIYSDI